LPASTSPCPIKKISGKSSFHTITQLKSDSSDLYDPQDIAQLLAAHFSSVSANSNYDDHFLTTKLQTEALPISFHTDNSSLPYNLPISLPELRSAIHKNLKNSAPGPDNIHAAMLKNIHPNALAYLLSLFNAILHLGTYSLAWKLATIIPILKPTKDPTVPGSYRPIVLICVLGKLLQKILNKRQFWFLESNNILSPSQYGFRKGLTLQALTDLNLQIETALLSNSKLYAIFFDFRKPFPVPGETTYSPNYIK